MTEFEGTAVCTCTKCGEEFEQEVVIDVEPEEHEIDH